jgi:asparagine synthase (glutamine-hydrolysing)
MIERPKMGFGIPMFEWFGGDLRNLFDEYFQESKLKKHNLFNITYIKQEFQKLKDDRALNINKLWFLLVFQMWYEKYHEK